MSQAAIARSLPFSEQAQLSWHEYLGSPLYKNSSRPTLEKILLVNSVKNSNEDIPDVNKQLKYDGKVKYDFLDGRLRYRGRTQEEFRFVVSDYEVFDLVVKTHLNLAHAGRQKTFDELDRSYYGITRNEVDILLKHCSTCAVKRSQTRKAPIKPIVINKLFGRVQVDLIDMSSNADGINKWICHMRDHFSKFSQAYPLERKPSENVARVV
ncbi:uncharacterized protein H6S33_007144 [Morchella sextelata]|uniref:uncharacterized protein n=1 Tax=Morchella sextelata TaxID=1174677 RepID=UPI001D049A45|nr:uncharacterized protein H6S33_007144 [Morchella sextelata]KAH0604113.1 hypothetical protein H6S33_007144 [Morchella sextelata]